MANETLIVVVGSLTADPELKHTQSGKSVVNFTVASTPRQYSRERNEWVDQDPLFLRCSQWGDPGEHVAASLTKGQRVIVQGYLKQRSWETREGEKRTGFELEVAEVGPSLRFGTAQFTRAGQGGQSGGSRPTQPPADDPWSSSPSGPSTPATRAQGDGWSQPAAYDEDVPF